MKRRDHLPRPDSIRAGFTPHEEFSEFRRPAPDVASDQWQQVYQPGRFNKMILASEGVRTMRLSGAKCRLGSQRIKVHRYQAVGQLKSFIENRSGEIVIGVSDRRKAFDPSRAADQLDREEMVQDLGLCTMFAPPDGNLLRCAWCCQLKPDAWISGLARRWHKQGIRPDRSRRCRKAVTTFRGLLRTEIGRSLNRLIQMKSPTHVILEKLAFRAPGLSKRLDQILTRSGRKVTREMLTDSKIAAGPSSTR